MTTLCINIQKLISTLKRTLGGLKLLFLKLLILHFYSLNNEHCFFFLNKIKLIKTMRSVLTPVT